MDAVWMLSHAPNSQHEVAVVQQTYTTTLPVATLWIDADKVHKAFRNSVLRLRTIEPSTNWSGIQLGHNGSPPWALRTNKSGWIRDPRRWIGKDVGQGSNNVLTFDRPFSLLISGGT